MFNCWLIRAVLIPLFMILCAGCSIPVQQQQSQTTEALQGQILLWAELFSNQEDLQRDRPPDLLAGSIAAFTELYPQVQVLVSVFPPGEAREAFEFQVERGAGPDLMLLEIGPELLPVIKSGALRTLKDTAVEEPLFRSETLKHIRYKGEFYGLPLYLSTQALCYNKAKVENEALPQSLSELIAQARRGYSVGIHSGFSETYWGIGVFGGQPFDAQGRIGLLQWSSWAEWLKWLKKAQNEPNVVLSDNDTALRQAFIEERLAYLTCETGWLPDFDKALGEGTLGLTVLPQGSEQPAAPILRTGLLLFSQASSPRQAEIALRLAHFLTNVEQQEQAEAAIPFIPSNRRVSINPRLFPIRSTLIEQSRTAVAFSLDNLEGGDRVISSGDRLYRRVLAGDLAPDEAAAQMAAIVLRQYDAGR
ncbi:MAG: extracellular solute-binding protein [Elainellaceae cyanobacterium]